MADLFKAAGEASDKARKSDDSDDHADAAELHSKAAKRAFKHGDVAVGKMHSKMAKRHRAHVLGLDQPIKEPPPPPKVVMAPNLNMPPGKAPTAGQQPPAAAPQLATWAKAKQPPPRR